MEEFFTLPEITDIENITPEQAKQYVQFVATLRHNQRRFFLLRNNEALQISKTMEKQLDALNDKLLNPTPTLF